MKTFSLLSLLLSCIGFIAKTNAEGFAIMGGSLTAEEFESIEPEIKEYLEYYHEKNDRRMTQVEGGNDRELSCAVYTILCETHGLCQYCYVCNNYPCVGCNAPPGCVRRSLRELGNGWKGKSCPKDMVQMLSKEFGDKENKDLYKQLTCEGHDE